MNRPVVWCAMFAMACSGCAVAGSETSSDASRDQIDAHVDNNNSHIDAHITGGGSGSGSGSSSGGCAFTGALATWDFTGASGSQSSTTASASAAGSTAGALTRASSLTATSGATSINSSNWPTGALDTTKYYSFSITPPSGCSMSLTSAALDAKASSSGPSSGAIATSADNFAHTSPASTSATSSPALSVSSASGSIEVRVYGFGATSAAGTFRLQNTLVLTGSFE